MCGQRALFKIIMNIKKYEESIFWTVIVCGVFLTMPITSVTRFKSYILIVFIMSTLAAFVGLWRSRRRIKRMRKQFYNDVPLSISMILKPKYQGVFGKYNEPVKETIVITIILIMLMRLWKITGYKTELNAVIALYGIVGMALICSTWYIFYLKNKK